ncbi:MAG: hypothetical protein P8H60_00960 [Schleiferiaceae bacterium]|nr:hypothetical protein [Schleiferiaceae bacterium]
MRLQWILLLTILNVNQSIAQSIINTSSISHDLDSTISIVIDAGGNISRGNSRVLFGGNISYDFSKEQSATAMIGLFHEAETYELSDSKSMVRMNFVAVAEQEIGNNEVIGFAYYQPSIMDLFDSRYITEVSVRFPIVKGFQLSVNGAGRFDSQPHSSLRNWDVGVSTTLRYEFHKS